MCLIRTGRTSKIVTSTASYIETSITSHGLNATRTTCIARSGRRIGNGITGCTSFGTCRSIGIRSGGTVATRHAVTIVQKEICITFSALTVH